MGVKLARPLFMGMHCDMSTSGGHDNRYFDVLQ